MSFLLELKRRNVFRVAVAYAVLSWIILQIASIAFPALNLPEWTMTMLIVFTIIGFPFVMLFAWAFELTPEGIKPTREVSNAKSIRSETGEKIKYFVIAGLVFALVLVVIDSYLLNDTPVPNGITDSAAPAPAEAPIIEALVELDKSLAVLPFADLSQEGDQEYFSDGLSEELLNKLAQVNDLHVTARTSSFYFKGRNEDMRSIGEQLGVNYILEGSVRKADNQVRITAQLIQADNGFHLWSGTYDRELKDIFKLQDEIAQAVTNALSITLGAGEFDLPGMTRNVEAYEEYLKAISQAFISTQGSVRQAIEHIERAVSLDPEFYNAWAWLVDIYYFGLNFLPQDQGRQFRERAEVAEKLLAENASDTPFSRDIAAQALRDSGNFVEAERQMRQLISDTGNSNSSYTLNYAQLLSEVGRSQDALPYYLMARRVNPIDPRVTSGLSRVYLDLGRDDEAHAEIERGLKFTSGLAEEILRRGYFWEAMKEGNKEKAIEALKSSGQDFQTGTPAYYWAQGDNESAMDSVVNSVSNENASGFLLNEMASWALILGDAQLALDIHRSGGFINNLWMDFSKEMRSLPDFKLFMKEKGILNYWRTTGNWADNCRLLEDSDDFECF